MDIIPRVSLNNGVRMPQLGYGLYKVPAEATASLVTLAIEAGYRSIDTATLYGNEAGLGQAVRALTRDGSVVDADPALNGGRALDGAPGLAREDLFITTKLWNTDQGYDAALAAFETSLDALGLEYIDLYLIHWPCPERDLYLDTYRAMERLYRAGRVRAIGVSNFEPGHLRALLDHAEVVPTVNQIELHPWLQQSELRTVHAEMGIQTEAWSPLGRGAVLADPLINELAAALGVSVAQVIIRWHLQLGNIVIPKASSAERIAENIDVTGFELSAEAMDRIGSLDQNRRFGSHPAEVN